MSDTTPGPIADPPADRVLVNKILAVLGPVLDRVREYVDAAQQNEQLRADLEAARAELLAARADAEDDAGADAAALGPLVTAVDRLRSLVWPATEASPEVTPVTDIDDVPGIVDGSLDPGVLDGRVDDPEREGGPGSAPIDN